MHVAAASPLALDPAGVDPATIAREKAVLADKNAGKPPHVLEKIVESGLKTFYKEVCLLDQAYVHDPPNRSPRRSRRRERASARDRRQSFVRFALARASKNARRRVNFRIERAAAGRPFLRADDRRRALTDRAREKPMFDRVVVKLSGEALMGRPVRPQRADGAAHQRRPQGRLRARRPGGGGGRRRQFFRGLLGAEKGIERARADSIGMLATVMNALAMEARSSSSASRPLLSRRRCHRCASPIRARRRSAISSRTGHRARRRTGNPFFTTDTGASLRACELSAGAVMKATQVDGVYTADPKRDPNAKRYDRLTHDEAIAATCRSWTPPPSRWRATMASRLSSSRSTSRGAIRAALLGQGRATYVMP